MTGRRIFSVTFLFIAAAVMLFLPVTRPVHAETSDVACQYLWGSNINGNDYPVRANPVESYLTTKGDMYMRVQGDTVDFGVVVAYYDKDFNILERKELPEELPLFGGFYESSGNYFIVTGQNNINENNNTEVIRITKYDKDWNRLGACGLKGGNTTRPFDAGSCRMAMSGNNLIIRTCHEMYASSDGLNHQANVTIQVNTSNMTITDSLTYVSYYKQGYVSHSFNQFVKFENNRIVALDHGDYGDTRGINLMKYPTDISSGSFRSSNVSNNVILTVPDADESHHYNQTGASIGAFEISGSAYLAAGNANTKNSWYIGNETRNIVVLSVNKSSGAVTKRWLTDYAEGEESVSTPHMARISPDRFMVLWTRGEKLYYVLINGQGEKVSEIYKKDGKLSDCAPVVIDGAVTWYTWSNADEALYRVQVDNPEDISVTERHFEHEYTLVNAADGNAQVRCEKCGGQFTAKVPDDFDVFWRDPKAADQSISYSEPPSIDVGDSLIYHISPEYSGENQDITLQEFVVESEDKESCAIDTDNKTIKFLKGGRINIIMYPEFNPDVKKTVTVRVRKDLESVKLVLDSDTAVVNSSIGMEAVADGGRGNLTYIFYAEKPGIAAREIGRKGYYSEKLWWFPYAAGEWQLYVAAVDDFDGRTVTSSKVTLTVEGTSDDGKLPWDDDGDDGSGWDNNGDDATNDDSGSDNGQDDSTWDDWINWDDPDYPQGDSESSQGISGGSSSVGPGATVAEAEEALKNMTSDGDPAGSRFAPLMLKSKTQKKSSIKLSWKSTASASKYLVYGNKCGRGNKLTKLTEVGAYSRAFNVKRIAGKKLKKGTYYKFIVIAVNNSNRVVSASKIIHVATAGGKVGNHKKVTVKRSVIKKAKKLKVGKILKMGAKAGSTSKKRKVKKHVSVRYESGDPTIATVNRKGKVKALRKGSVMIYAYAQNGVSKAVRITIK